MLDIQYCCTHWGCEHDSATTFINKVLAAGYNGIEINLPGEESSFTPEFLQQLDELRKDQPGFLFIPQQLSVPGNGSVGEYIDQLKRNIEKLASYQPYFINSHTGRDYLSFDDNCRAIEACLNISARTGIKVFHETHRGRFSFHAPSLIAYIDKFPEMELVGDYSHFCAVSESLLENQQDALKRVMQKVSHLHARIGWEQGPQVNDPFAPEWNHHFEVFEGWWQQTVEQQKVQGKKKFSITPEHGPAPYMPLLPYSKEPVANQWEVNVKIKERLQNTIQR